MIIDKNLSRRVWTLSKVSSPHPCLSYQINRTDTTPIVNVILVAGHEKLNVEMQRTYGAHMTVVKIPKSGGVSSYISWILVLAR
jgi:hypothetical protein